MRQLATAPRIRAFLSALGRAVDEAVTAYLTGGSTAVLVGWRESTIDVDIKFVPDSTAALRAIPALKERLQINVELASPDLFIPVPGNWADHSPWVFTEGHLIVRHFDLTAQAVSKLERGHARDLVDVREMLDRGLVSPGAIRAYLDEVEPEWYRYPAVDPGRLGRMVDDFLRSRG